MATLADIQKRLDDKTLDPSKLSREDRRAIDELIKRGKLKGPTMSELEAQSGPPAPVPALRKPPTFFESWTGS